MGGQFSSQYAAARIGMPKRDDFASARIKASEHDCGFDRLGPGVRKKGLGKIPRSDLREALGKADLGLIEVESRRMTESA